MQDGEWPVLGHHANVVRQFQRVYYDETSVGSNRPGFVLVKVETVVGRDHLELTCLQETRTPTAGRKASQAQQRRRSKTAVHTFRSTPAPKAGKEDVTDIVIVSKRGLEIMLNPILVHAVQNVLPAMYRTAVCPMLDGAR
jgi:hypothetical protein